MNIKDKLEIIESILSIIVSLSVIIGGILAYRSEFVHKVNEITNAVHKVVVEQKKEGI